MALHIKHQIPLQRAKRKLDKALQQNSFGARVRNRITMVRTLWDANAILSESDTPDIRLLKEAFVSQVKIAGKGFRKVVGVFIVGIAPSVVAAIVENIFKGKP